MSEVDIDRLRSLATTAGVPFRVQVDLHGEAALAVGGLGDFDEVRPAEDALRGLIAVRP